MRTTPTAAALVLLSGGLLLGCSGTTTSTDSSTTAGTAGSGTSSTAADQSTTTAGDSGGGGNGQSGGGQSGGGQTPTTASSSGGTGPVITSFSTPDSIDCHNGMAQTFTASWSTTNADKVTISIDGPGVYKTYDPNGSDSLPFNCSSSHTFLLTAYGSNGQTVNKSVTLQPRNVQTSTPTEDDDATTTSTSANPSNNGQPQ